MPFGAMVRFIVKWVIASIPAMLILLVLFGIFAAVLALLFGGVFHSLIPPHGTRF